MMPDETSKARAHKAWLDFKAMLEPAGARVVLSESVANASRWVASGREEQVRENRQIVHAVTQSEVVRLAKLTDELEEKIESLGAWSIDHDAAIAELGISQEDAGQLVVNNNLEVLSGLEEALAGERTAKEAAEKYVQELEATITQERAANGHVLGEVHQLKRRLHETERRLDQSAELYEKNANPLLFYWTNQEAR